jgi:hypothetical protein
VAVKFKISDFVADSQRWSLTYAEAEATLAELHGVTGDVQQRAFRARLKHLKRLGIPAGINPGRGAKIYYKDEQLYEWAFCLELAEFGIDPAAIVRLMEQNFKTDILQKIAECRIGQHDPDDLYFVAAPSLMSASWQDRETLPYEWLKRSRAERWFYGFGRSRERTRRAIFINVTALANAIGRIGIKVQSKTKE